MQTRFKNSEIFCLKWIGGTCIQYLTPTMPMNISWKFSQVYTILHSLSKLSRLKKTLQNPWMTKGLLKSSKRKQKLYEKFLKKRTSRNESIYKAYKSLFESLKKNSKKLLYKTSWKLSKWYKEIVGCNQGDYCGSKIN